MKLLIAGWHGQIARALMQAATQAPDVVQVAAVRPALDQRDPNSLERTFRTQAPTIAINTAAFTAVDAAEDNPERAFALNKDGAARFARAAARRDIPVIHLSTHYVFDGTKTEPYTERDNPTPSTVYGRSKHEGEIAVAQENPHHIILRTGWIFSPIAPNFATRILDAVNAGEPLRIVADQIGNPTYAPHLAALLLDLARKIMCTEHSADIPWGTYHAPSPGSTTWHGLATALAESYRENRAEPYQVDALNSQDYPCRAPRPTNSTLDSEKFAAAFGLYVPSWQSAASTCAAEFRKAAKSAEKSSNLQN